MTNPNPTETAEPRWIPAAEKPGGLVFGDRVKLTSTEAEGCFLGVNPFGHHIARVGWPDSVRNESPPVIKDHQLIADLLVRIDPPAQLPESTDAFRQGWLAAAMHLQKLGDNKESLLIEDDAEGYRQAAGELRMTTPTEAVDGPETDDHGNK